MKTLATITCQGLTISWKYHAQTGEHVVTYGKQVTFLYDDLEACHEYGECLRHLLELEVEFN